MVNLLDIMDLEDLDPETELKDVVRVTHEYKGVKGRICDFLGSGLSPEVVSSAVGVQASYVSQLLSDEAFAGTVTALRLEKLQDKTDRDSKYDSLEDKLLAKMDNVIQFMTKPMDIVRALTLVNSTKRRGTPDDAGTTINNNAIITLVLPESLMPKFTSDINNQVVAVGGQTLVTMQSGGLDAMVAKRATLMQDTEKLQGVATELSVDLII